MCEGCSRASPWGIRSYSLAAAEGPFQNCSSITRQDLLFLHFLMKSSSAFFSVFKLTIVLM